MAESIEHIRLSDLARKIQKVINFEFSDKTFWVIAEISNHKYYAAQSRHYFTLVEKVENSNSEVAKLSGKSWEQGSKCIEAFERATNQRFKDGLEVLIKVRVEYHPIYELSVTLLDIDAAFTIGNLAKQREQTLKQLIDHHSDIVQFLHGEYITRNKKLAHSHVIQNIALVASENSKGYTDFMDALSKNRFKYTFAIDYYFSSVQGIDAEKDIVNAFIGIFNSKKKYDAVVLIRGGGAQTDFLVFDTFKIALAIAKFPIPIITGIGHHEDVSIADLMAHTHTNAPTKAAEYIVSHNRAFEDEMQAFRNVIIIKTQQSFSKQMQALNEMRSAVVNTTRSLISANKEDMGRFNNIIINKSKDLLVHLRTELINASSQLIAQPKIILGNASNNIVNLSSNIQVNSKKFLTNSKGYLGHFQSVIKMMSLDNILNKGFAVIYHKGQVISSADAVKQNDDLMVRLRDTEITTLVKSKKQKDGREPFL